jgi:hypothetical protein
MGNAERGLADSLLQARSQRHNLKRLYIERNCFINLKLMRSV